MSDRPTCPDCGTPLPEGSPRGLCPQCLLLLGLDGPSLSLSAAGEAGATISMTPAGESTTGGSVLKTLAAAVGPVPRVLLRDTDPIGGPGPAMATSPPDAPDPGDRLQVFGEIARGGMGAVLRGRDPDLNRELAVKVLLERHRENPDLIRRFVEEAQIAGQLQHPGIVPVYELGTFADRRPYFSMKLVKGRTLAQILAARPGPTHETAGLVGVFHQVCQTMAYAHARGVIHRDLKPSNVMVGAFGEVQVMDWGLAKVLPQGGTADDASAGRTPEPETIIATARGEGDSDLSRAGSVLGTPSYMAPEQARGEAGRVGERADVFALGSILCEILTGQPAFVGRNALEILRKAERADLDDATSRLAACGADAELVELALACLAAQAEDRPRDAGGVADRLTAHLVGVQERLRSAELARAAESARAEEAGRTAAAAEARARAERKARRLTAGLAAATLLIAALVGSAGIWVSSQRQALARRAEGAIGEGEGLLRIAREKPEDETRWVAASEAVKRAETVLAAGGSSALRRRVASLRERVEHEGAAADLDRSVLAELAAVRTAAPGSGAWETEEAYARAFARLGIDVDRPEAAVSALRARSARVAAAVVPYLEDRAWVRSKILVSDGYAQRPLDLADSVNRDPVRDVLRSHLMSGGNSVAQASRKSLKLAPIYAKHLHEPGGNLAPSGVVTMARILQESSDNESALSLLEWAVQRYPNDVWINHQLGVLLTHGKFNRPEEALRYLTAARAVRPELAHKLVHLLEDMGRIEEAIGLCSELTRLRPEDPLVLAELGRMLSARGREEEGVVMLKRAAAILLELARKRPNDSIAHHNLAAVYLHLRDWDRAIAAEREAVRLRPDVADYRVRLAGAYKGKGAWDEALEEAREAVRLSPVRSDVQNLLGVILSQRGDWHGAARAFEAAVLLRPDDPDLRFSLGVSLGELGDADGAIAAYRAILKRDPGNEKACSNLANILISKGRGDEAIETVRAALKANPRNAGLRYLLGTMLGRLKDDADGAIAELREAIRLKPDYAAAHNNLGMALRKRGDYDGALEHIRKAHQIRSKQPGWPDPTGQRVREAEHDAALARRLPQFLSGEARPQDADEALRLAQISYEQSRHAAAAGFSAEALQMEPKVADDRQLQRRYNAACAAALAGCGRGKDDPRPNEAARIKLRLQALGWLRAELETWSKMIDARGGGGAPSALRPPAGEIPRREQVVRVLEHWKTDPELAGVRNEAELRTIPEAERKDWQALWADVDAVLRKAQAK